jgi:hypothetical protein
LDAAAAARATAIDAPRDGVGAELGLFGRAVQRDQQSVDLGLSRCIITN